MIRILYVIPTLDRSGAEKQLSLLASRLPRDEFQPDVCALTRGGPFQAELDAAGIRVTVLGKRLKVDPLAAWKLRGLLRRGAYDIVHTWLFAANWHGRLMAMLHRVPIVVASERCADEWKGTLELAIDRLLAPRTDAVVVNSRSVLEFYKSHGVDESKLVLIPNGIVPEQAPESDRAAVLRELNLPPDARVLGFVGRLWPQKRIKDAIWATEVVRNLHSKLFLVIAGDGPERNALEEFTGKIWLTEHVRFLGHREDVPRLLAGMDIFVLPSEFEGMPNAVMEAMNAGLPVIASDIPGTNELVVDGQTGFLYPLGDTKELSKRLNQLVEDKSLREKLGGAGRERIRQEFDVDRMVDAHVKLYRDLVAIKRPVPQERR